MIMQVLLSVVITETVNLVLAQTNKNVTSREIHFITSNNTVAGKNARGSDNKKYLTFSKTMVLENFTNHDNKNFQNNVHTSFNKTKTAILRNYNKTKNKNRGHQNHVTNNSRRRNFKVYNDDLETWNSEYLEFLNTKKKETISINALNQSPVSLTPIPQYLRNQATLGQQQIDKEIQLVLIQHKLIATTKRLEQIREPYWVEGEWVFLRTSTLRTTKAKVNGSTPPTTSTRFTLKEINRFRDCNVICPNFYREYGKICGSRYNYLGYRYEYKVFDNLCLLDMANCEKPHSRWYPIHRGECAEMTPFVPYPNDWRAVYKHKNSYHPFSWKPSVQYPWATTAPGLRKI